MSNYVSKYYHFGQDAYHMGVPQDDNPYTPGSAAYESWDAGHCDAWYESTYVGENNDE